MEGLARVDFKRYVATIYELVVIKSVAFDMLLVNGNSGSVMARLAQMIYWYLGIDPPVVVKTYLRRRTPGVREGQDDMLANSILVYDIRNQLIDFNIKRAQKILFVDDEIGSGFTAMNCADLLIRALGSIGKPIDHYIVAEDLGIEKFAAPDNAKIHLVPFAKSPQIVGMIGSIVLRFTPNDMIYPLLEWSDYMDHIFCILLDLPSRPERSSSALSYHLNGIATSNVPNLNHLKQNLNELVNTLIHEAIEEYKAGVINLNDFEYARYFVRNDWA